MAIDGLRVGGHPRVVHPNGCVRAIPAPPLNGFLEKGILRPGRKEVPIEVTGLGIKENEDGHWSRLRDEWCVHRDR
jgi:hypothetical protein